MRTFTQVHKEVIDNYARARNVVNNGFTSASTLKLTELATKIYSDECQVEISLNNARGRNGRLRSSR